MFVLMLGVESAYVVAREGSMIPGTHLQYITQDEATHTRYVPTLEGNIRTTRKKKRDTCIQQCTPLAADGQVGVGFSVGW